jgi:hypothetical protein
MKKPLSLLTSAFLTICTLSAQAMPIAAISPVAIVTQTAVNCGSGACHPKPVVGPSRCHNVYFTTRGVRRVRVVCS